MMYNLRFAPEIEVEVLKARKWYNFKSIGLGDEFLELFYASTLEIQENPLLYPKIHKYFHRRLMFRFPYAIYYRFENDEIVILGCFHTSRNPNFITSSIEKRDKY